MSQTIQEDTICISSTYTQCPYTCATYHRLTQNSYTQSEQKTSKSQSFCLSASCCVDAADEKNYSSLLRVKHAKITQNPEQYSSYNNTQEPP